MFYERKWAPLLIICLIFAVIWDIFLLMDHIVMRFLFFAMVAGIHASYVFFYFREKEYIEGLRVFRSMKVFFMLLGIVFVGKMVIFILSNSEMFGKWLRGAVDEPLFLITGFFLVALLHCLYFLLIK